MNCASCGNALPDGAAFCGNCGATVGAGVLRVTLDDDTAMETAPATPSAPAYAAGPVAAVYGAPATPQSYAPQLPGATPYRYGGTPRAERGNAGIVGAIIGIVGAAIVIAGAWLTWVDGAVASQSSSFHFSFGFLFDYKNASRTDAGFGILLMALAIVGAVVSLIPKVGIVRNICGAGVLIIAVLFLVQSSQFIDGLNNVTSGFGSSSSIDLGDWLGIGFYVTAFGGLLMAAGPPRLR